MHINIAFLEDDHFPNALQNNIFDSLDNSVIEASMNESSRINHYYIAIDLRTIRLENPESCQILLEPFYLQFSYAFFGITDFIKTYPSIRFPSDNLQDSITIPHGFCGFNFATTQEKMIYTFTNIPFVVQLILEKGDTLLGTSELDLSCLIQKQVKSKNNLNDNFVNTYAYVQDELNDKICEIQVVMFLQEIQNLSSIRNIKEIDLNLLNLSTSKEDLASKELIDSLNDMIIETAHDIEIWKEEQMKHFKNKLKKKELDFLQNFSNAQNVKNNDLVEENIKIALEKIAEKEKIILQQEEEINARQKELDNRFSKFSQEINTAIHEVRIQYEEKTNKHKDQLKTMEQEKYKYQEKIYQLERKIKEKDLTIKELESKLFEQNQSASRKLQNQRATSLTRNVASSSRKIIITRDSE